MRERYQTILPTIRAIARQHGYAIGLHGSGLRDLDLIAVPWVEDARPVEALIEAIRAGVNGYFAQSVTDGTFVGRNPMAKPHGRQSWAIRLLEDNADGALYLDLSVMPRERTNGDG